MNPYARLAIVFDLWEHLPGDAVLTPAISPIIGRFVEGRSAIFLPPERSEKYREVSGSTKRRMIKSMGKLDRRTVW